MRTVLFPILVILASSACSSTPNGGGTGGAASSSSSAGGMGGSGGSAGTGGMGGSGGSAGAAGAGGMGGAAGAGGMGGSGGSAALWSRMFLGQGTTLTDEGSKPGSTYVRGIAADAAGNTLIAGEFTGDVDLGDGKHTASSDQNFDMFVGKLGPGGVTLWSKEYGDTTHKHDPRIVADAAGNVIFTANTAESFDFGFGVQNPPGTGWKPLVGKLDGNGVPLWGHVYGPVGGAGNAEVLGVDVDTAGNIIFVGRVFDCTFDLGNGVTMGPSTSNDAFVAKLDPNGNALWGKTFTGGNVDTAVGVAVDASGNLLLTGYFGGTLDIGTGPETSQSGADIFAMKLDPQGQGVWLRHYASVMGQDPRAIAVASDGRVAIGGAFSGVVDFGSGPVLGDDARDGYVAVLSPSGATLWARVFAGAGNQVVRSVAFDGKNRVLVAGHFAGDVDFGGGIVFNAGKTDTFLVALGDAGQWLAGRTYGDADNQLDALVAPMADGKALISLIGRGTVDLGVGPHSSPSSFSSFVARTDP